MPPPSASMAAPLRCLYSIIACVDGFKREVHSRALVQPDDRPDVADVATCPNCLVSTEHEVLRRTPRGTGEDLLVKCMDCGDVHNIELRPPKAVSITATLSDGGLSTSDIIEVDEDEVISVGDLFEHDEAQWEVTRIDGAASQPFDGLPAGDIRALWAVRKDRAVVRLTMTDGEDSVASSIECEPDRVFTCGTILEIDGRRWRIRALHTGKGRTLRGSREASELRRMYLHLPNKRRY